MKPFLLIGEYVYRLAAAKSPQELSSVGGYILQEKRRDSLVRFSLVFPVGVEDVVRPRRGGRWFGDSHVEVGVFGIEYDSSCQSWLVTASEAPRGWGPLLYDVAIEYAGKKGLAPDRADVTSLARQVWRYYYQSRKDISSRLLPDECQSHSEEFMDSSYISLRPSTISQLKRMKSWRE